MKCTIKSVPLQGQHWPQDQLAKQYDELIVINNNTVEHL